MDQKKKKRKKIGPKVCLLSLQYLTSETTPLPPKQKQKQTKNTIVNKTQAQYLVMIRYQDYEL